MENHGKAKIQVESILSDIDIALRNLQEIISCSVALGVDDIIFNSEFKNKINKMVAMLNKQKTYFQAVKKYIDEGAKND